MDIIGDRHYKAAPGEQLTFSAGASVTVGSITTDRGPLPVTIVGGTHQTLMVTVGFTSMTGGSLIVSVTGSGVTDTSKVRQLATLAKRSASFVVD
jgi:hypothetical protein